MLRYAIIVAGGKGSRMNGGKPKQFLLLAGKPVLMHTVEKFHSGSVQAEIIVLLPEEEIKEWKSLCTIYDFQIPHEIASGGDLRFQSVKNGLQVLENKTNDNDSFVAIHDGARPIVSVELIQRCFNEAEKFGNAVPCLPVTESIRIVRNDNTSKVADRQTLVAVQTPQCFQLKTLLKAYSAEYQNIFTDDASVVESIGEKIHLINGEPGNIKLTYPSDLAIAEALMRI